MGYHRLLTHRGYETPRWLEYFLTICGTLALQGGPLFWVATHRLHHHNSDKTGDPHSPRDGWWWSHAGWLVRGDPMRDTALARYVPDLERDAFHRWLEQWHVVPMLVLSVLLAVWGAIRGGVFLAASLVSWGIFLRTTVELHGTWLVNSAAHTWGSRRFATPDDSTNNWWVALLTFGEGWHNNHHADPRSVRHGLAWYELDINWLCIRALRQVGLARKLCMGYGKPPASAGISYFSRSFVRKLGPVAASATSVATWYANRMTFSIFGKFSASTVSEGS